VNGPMLSGHLIKEQESVNRQKAFGLKGKGREGRGLETSRKNRARSVTEAVK